MSFTTVCVGIVVIVVVIGVTWIMGLLVSEFEDDDYTGAWLWASIIAGMAITWLLMLKGVI